MIGSLSTAITRFPHGQAALSLLIRMPPLIRRDLPRPSQLPDRRIPRAADGIERKARAGLAAVALDLEPAEPAIEALPDGGRRLRRPAGALHADRPRFGLRAVGLASSLFGGCPRVFGLSPPSRRLTSSR